MKLTLSPRPFFFLNFSESSKTKTNTKKKKHNMLAFMSWPVVSPLTGYVPVSRDTCPLCEGQILENKGAL